MPAARPRSSGLPVVVTKSVNDNLSLEKYFRSANLLIRQAKIYRSKHDDYQVYTMLLRLASLVIETIPTHKDFNKNASIYKNIRKELVNTYLPELEELKRDLKLRHEDQDRESWYETAHSRAAPDAVQLSTSNLPQLNWGQQQPNWQNGSPGLSSPGSFDVDLLDRFETLTTSANSQPSAQPGPARLSSSTSLSGDFVLPTFSTSVKPISQEAKDRHALMPSLQAPKIKRQSSSGGSVASYPTFDSTPWKPIDYRMATSNNAESASQANVLPSAPPLTANGQDTQGSQSLMDMEHAPRPMPSPLLGPQELEVTSMAQPIGPPDPRGTCSHVVPPPPPPDEQPGDVKKIKGLREVHLSLELVKRFLDFAERNTKRNVESCGILGGTLDTKRGAFFINSFIYPKQQGTSDTVTALAEEEIFEAQDSRGLFPMGWIHTHPSQTCFLSSIDVHTQCGYQTMLDEAIAIVLAPTDSREKVGVFRLSTVGLKTVQKCERRGFHHHDSNVPIYDKCGHVFLNERLPTEVIDLS